MKALIALVVLLVNVNVMASETLLNEEVPCKITQRYSVSSWLLDDSDLQIVSYSDDTTNIIVKLVYADSASDGRNNKYRSLQLSVPGHHQKGFFRKGRIFSATSRNGKSCSVRIVKR